MKTFYYKIETPQGDILLVKYSPDGLVLAFDGNIPITKITEQEHTLINKLNKQ